jgi:phage protein D
VTVQGFDRASQKPINYKLDLTSDDMKKINKNVQYLLNQCDPRDEFVVEKPFDNLDEAQKYAKAVFTDQVKRVVKATGTTVGLPKLRAGCRVSIPNLGTRLSGTYFVTGTTHTFSATGGYTTRFEARMENQE